MKDLFRKFSNATADKVGSPGAFAIGVVVVVIWAFTGPMFHYSDTWQLVINTGTSIGTFLMVFLIQNTQNRDARAMHLKLDELIRAASEARNTLVNLEAAPDEVIDELKTEFQALRELEPGTGQLPESTSSAAAESPAERSELRPHSLQP